jgi:hypothetical protein
MKIVSKMVTDPETRRKHLETLIQTELGSYYVSEEDLATGEVMTRRVTANEAREFREIAGGSAAPTGSDS